MSDRAFNAECANRLRALGFSVFMPQESGVNDRTAEPGAEAIFVTDTSELLSADALVAVLDQETIDAGVACEIGVACAAGLPVFGLYTDIRQYRTGTGRMYKNLYVVGAISCSGGRLFPDVESLIAFISEDRVIPNPSTVRMLETQTNAGGNVAISFDEFVARLESWYAPPWRRARFLRTALAECRGYVLDYGCGTGRAFDDVKALAPSATYIGYDGSTVMVDEARNRHPEALWSTQWEELGQICAVGFDAILLHFVLHDQNDRAELCQRLVSTLRSGGCLHIIDLGMDDLPRTTAALRRALAGGWCRRDRRMGTEAASELSTITGCAVLVDQEEVFDVTFPSLSALDAYLSVFDIYGGADLPLGIVERERDRTRSRVLRSLQSLTFPWRDLRVFRVVVLEKT